MLKIKINFGGSHRKNPKCIEKLRPFLVRDTLFMPMTIGGKRIEATAYDSPELREMLRSIGGSVSRYQPDWLNGD